ncbi:hypothetical protein BT96DRAFT_943368 [Gymnopus androsaceus JB14]|uniref:H(+)-exporting diphosphatase n=1 Tax=Gymnopus androsaceus JB14 TaxID=1447944 RepID=A0A6A4H905_9AGAR|nr:hypothetical protein BT96DRAFT_943368 [Gymnopus androsaceus JB14]
MVIIAGVLDSWLSTVMVTIVGEYWTRSNVVETAESKQDSEPNIFKMVISKRSTASVGCGTASEGYGVAMYTASVGCGTTSEGYGEAMPAVFGKSVGGWVITEISKWFIPFLVTSVQF